MASEATHPPSSSSNAADSFIGSLVSLISRSDIRYEGFLYCLDVKDATIGLKNVKSYGTEGRRKDGPQVPPSEKVYEFILFRGSDIKDLQVKSSPPAKSEEQLYNDPAIIQTHYPGVSFSSPPVAVGGKSQFHDTPAVITRVKPEELHPYQSGVHLSVVHQTQSAQSLSASRFSTPISSQSYNRAVISPVDHTHHSIPSLSQPSPLVPGTVQNQVQLSDHQSSVLTTTSEGTNPIPTSVASFPVHPTLSSSPTLMQLFNSPVLSSSTPNLSLSPFSPLVPSNNLAMPPMVNSQAVPDRSLAYPAASGRPTLGPPLTPPLSTPAPNQLAQPGFNVLPQMQKRVSNNYMGTAMPAEADIFSISSQTPGKPLLPPPTPAPQQNSSAPFTEEFDFEAMNEKFKKDEVWGALGKLDKRDIAETEESAFDQNFGVRESNGLSVKNSATAAYKKDDFFDMISCNSLSQGARTGQNRFSERMKMDAETFGNFRVRPPHQNYGTYGAGRGQNYRGQYSWGRGYGYGGRGNSRNMP
ncbi:hypothetical protein CDL15_Pgr018160 [Punica granatum]|uniref:Decapping 5-like protein n=1 Tax=Punica granatum TaxID=22663 RepID=A0A218WHH8_PUNGR|nr:hypothetical protein CDL15_Pgr018160 [Punica granatum]PKI57265.1 hypothetical protein CRG98_022362 [Punica granatum]